jgi:holo-[acyl-carrier protein] synthase
MSRVVTGIDMVEIPRLDRVLERHGDRFLLRVYTENELSQAGNRSTSLAARFAAKEAVAKALGTGIGRVGWRDIEVLRSVDGQPTLHLYGKAAEIAVDLAISSWSVSLTHTRNTAAAVVVGIREY